MTPDHVVFGRRTDAFERIDDAILSCPCPDVQRTIQTSCPYLCEIASEPRDTNCLPWGLVPYDARGIRQRPAPGLPSPAVLRLQTFSGSWRFDSARNRSRLVSCEWRPWVSSFQRLSLTENGESFTASLPFMLFLVATFRTGKPARCPRHRSSKGVRNRRVRIGEHGVTRRAPTDPLLALPLSEVFTSLVSTPCFHGISSHGLVRLAEWQATRRDVCSAEFQRTRK